MAYTALSVDNMKEHTASPWILSSNCPIQGCIIKTKHSSLNKIVLEKMLGGPNVHILYHHEMILFSLPFAGIILYIILEIWIKSSIIHK